MAEDLDKKLDDLDKKLTPERLRKLYKLKILEKINRGEVGLVDEIQRLTKLESPSPSPSSLPTTEDDLRNYGIPERLRVKRCRYTLTPEALEQRRKAAKSPKKREAMKGNKNAWKTGEHAQGFIRQVFRPCKSTCPRFPCSLVTDGEAEPGEDCLDKAELAKALQAVQSALRTGKLDDFKDLVAVRLAGGIEIVKQLIDDVLSDGTVVLSEKIDKDGRILGHEVRNHPSLFPLAKLIEALNISPTDFMITPKEIAKHKIDKRRAKTLADIMSGIGLSQDDDDSDSNE